MPKPRTKSKSNASKSKSKSKSKSNDKAQSKSISKSKHLNDNHDQQLPTSDVCRVCEKYGDSPDYACEDCPHSYHDHCIDEQFRNKGFANCEDLGFECQPDMTPIQFEFGPRLDTEIKSKRQKRAAKKRSKRTNKKTKKRRMSMGGHQNVTQTNYKSLMYQNREYKVGDDVVISMDDHDGGWGVGRITSIYHKHHETQPTFDLIWFWRANEVNNKLPLKNYSEMKDIQKGSEQDIEAHELHLDEKCGGDMPLCSLIDNERSSKALVVSSTDEYLMHLRSDKYKQEYYDIYWCSHAYDQHTYKKTLIPAGIISKHAIMGITPKPQNNKRQSRKRNRGKQIDELLQDASKALMLSSVPTKLPCREVEHAQIERYMKNQISCYGQGSGLYISGMPGTGKTATVRQIARELRRFTGKRGRSGRNLPEFEFHEINAMKLPTPKHLYTELCKKLMDRHFAPNTAVKKLEKYFSTKDVNRKICVLLVDELDYLLTRQQKVIYNIFDWPTKSNAKLVVIGIANTMDLPERLLPRVASRMGTTRVVFKAYQREQLIQIIKQRLEATKVFSNDAIGYCAMAVAGVSGDCRTALQICRRAVEIAQADIKENGFIENEKNTKRAKTSNNNRRRKRNDKIMNDNGDDDDTQEIVTLHHLKKAKDSFDQSNDVQIVSTLSIYEKLFLTGIVMHNSRNNVFAGQSDIYRRKFDNFIDTRLGETRMKSSHFRNLLDRLKEMGIITITFEKKEWIEYIKFNIPIEEAAHALKENDICANIISTLQSI